MKTLRYFALMLPLLVALGLPALAQREPDRVGGDHGNPNRNKSILQGTVAEVTGTPQRPSVKLTLAVQVADVNAPGKTPDDVALRIAELEDLLARWRGAPDGADKPRMVARLETTLRELRRWREVSYTLTDANVPIEGVRLTALNDAPIGMRLRLAGRARGQQAPDQLPDRLIIVRDAMQVGANTPLAMRAVATNADRGSFFEVVGEVVSTSPVVLKIADNQTVTLDGADTRKFLQNVPLQLSDLNAGMKVHARVKMRGEQEIGGIENLRVIQPGVQPSMLTDESVGLEAQDVILASSATGA